MTSIEFIEFSEILKYFFRIPVLYKKKKSTEYKFIESKSISRNCTLLSLFFNKKKKFWKEKTNDNLALGYSLIKETYMKLTSAYGIDSMLIKQNSNQRKYQPRKGLKQTKVAIEAFFLMREAAVFGRELLFSRTMKRFPTSASCVKKQLVFIKGVSF